eukprot:15073565-Alexandrium_andersonii.AAC.1
MSRAQGSQHKLNAVTMFRHTACGSWTCARVCCMWCARTWHTACGSWMRACACASCGALVQPPGACATSRCKGAGGLLAKFHTDI